MNRKVIKDAKKKEKDTKDVKDMLEEATGSDNEDKVAET